MPSASSDSNAARMPARRSSVGGASVVSVASEASVSTDDNWLTPPARGHVFVLDPFLQQDDALEQRLGPRRATRHVDVDRDDLIDALGDGVAVPVRAAAVGARA